MTEADGVRQQVNIALEKVDKARATMLAFNQSWDELKAAILLLAYESLSRDVLTIGNVVLTKGDMRDEHEALNLIEDRLLQIMDTL